MHDSQKIRIGTRDSKLALWQARYVQNKLQDKGVDTELVTVKSEGDLDLVTPLYAMGVEGVFTKTLDAYLLSHKIDIAVHSMKDVPTQTAQGIIQAAVMPRASYHDLLVLRTGALYPKYFSCDKQIRGIIATGSVRRAAQLRHYFPNVQIENLRGNVQTRMKKLQESAWDAAVFAAAGLERINERPVYAEELQWMLPAPAQGAIMVVCRENEPQILNHCHALNDAATALCVKNERDFLKALMGGCSTPISALAEINGNTLRFRGNILSIDGREKIEIEKSAALDDAQDVGSRAAAELLSQGADRLVAAIRTTGHTH